MKLLNITTLLIIIFFASESCSPKEKKITVETIPAQKKEDHKSMCLQDLLKAKSEGAPFEIVRVNLTADTCKDYFIIDGMSISHGSFFDGKTGNEIPIDSFNAIWSRPGVGIEYKIIDVNCGDGQKELLIRYGGGGTVGEYYTTQVFRYDQHANEMKLIFEKEISSFSWDKNSMEVLNEANYIDINYRSDSCINIISVSKGLFKKGKKEPYSLNIIPDKKYKSEDYHFNVLTNNFELAK